MTLPDLLGNGCGPVGLQSTTGLALAPTLGLGVDSCPDAHSCSINTGSARLGSSGSITGVKNDFIC